MSVKEMLLRSVDDLTSHFAFLLSNAHTSRVMFPTIFIFPFHHNLKCVELHLIKLLNTVSLIRITSKPK